MDLFMPEKDGLETLIELRQEFPHVAVIAMSGRKVELMLRAAKGLGAIRTIAKPFEPEALLALVAEGLNWVREAKTARLTNGTPLKSKEMVPLYDSARTYFQTDRWSERDSNR